MNIKFSKEDIHTGSLILVNHRNPLKQEKPPRCVAFSSLFPDIPIHPKASSCLRQLLNAVNAGDCIVPVSGYRTAEEQRAIYEKSLKENGMNFTRKFVAKPGCSEHESGLAIDLGIKADIIDFVCPDFPDYGVCADFRRLACRYGFVQRYEKSKESITGIACEPWHFRYVGYPHSEIMVKLDLCLEEYVEYVKYFPYGRSPLQFVQDGRQIQIFYADCSIKEIEVKDNVIAEISGNNTDGRIITLWN